MPSSWGLRPQTPVYDAFELHWFAHHVSQFRHFYFSTFRSSPSPSAKSWLRAKASNSFSSSILRYHCPVKSFWFPKCLKTYVIYPFPPIQNPGSPMMTPSIKSPSGRHHLNFESLCSDAASLSLPSLLSACCNSENFLHLDFTDRHNVTIMSFKFVTYTNKNCAIYFG